MKRKLQPETADQRTFYARVRVVNIVILVPVLSVSGCPFRGGRTFFMEIFGKIAKKASCYQSVIDKPSII